MKNIIILICAILPVCKALCQEVVEPSLKSVADSDIRFNSISTDDCLCSLSIDYVIDLDGNLEPRLSRLKIRVLNNSPQYCLSLMDPNISLKVQSGINGNMVTAWINGLAANISPDEPVYQFSSHRDFDSNSHPWGVFLAYSPNSDNGLKHEYYESNRAKAFWNSDFKVVDIRIWPRKDYKKLLASTSTEFNKTQKKAGELEKTGKYEEARQVWEKYKRDHPEDSARAEKEQKKIIAELGEKNDKDQKQRNAAGLAAGTAQVGLMFYLGGFMYSGIGKDKPQNIQTRNGLRFNLTYGYSFARMPIYTNRDRSSYIGTQPFNTKSVDKGTVNTLNLDLGIQFWPYYGENAGIGIIANGFGGYLPLAGTNSSYNYQYGGQVFLGFKSFKVIGTYLMGDRGFDYSDTFTTSIGSGTTYTQSNGASAFKRLMPGIRISLGQADFKTDHIDLCYILENYNNMKDIKASGLNITYSNHNRIKIYAEYLFNAARIGILQPGNELDSGLTNNGSYFVFGVVRSLDIFAR